MASGIFAYITGNLIYLYLTYSGHNPFPSIADIFYLSIYPLILAGILSLPYAPLQRMQRILFKIDLVIIVLAFGAFLWYLVLARLAEKGTGGLPGLVSMAYPIADLLLLTGLVSLIQQDVKDVERRVLIFLFSGMLSGISADLMYALMQIFQLQDSALLMLVSSLFRFLSYLAFLMAALWQLRSARTEMKPATNFLPLLRSNLLYIAASAVILLSFIALISLSKINWRITGTLIGALSITALVLIRQSIVIKDNQNLHLEILRLANTDPLTELANRRLFEQTLSQELLRYRRYHNPFSILLIDLNSFKKYNDRFGHLKGDYLLKDCADVIKAHVRTTDLVARFGGDEFIIILPETEYDGAEIIAQRLRDHANTVLAPRTGVSFSIGCATIRKDMTETALLELADQAMYKEKTHHSR